jgi:hypothetical protein
MNEFIEHFEIIPGLISSYDLEDPHHLLIYFCSCFRPIIILY